MASARYTRNITPDAPEAPHVMTRQEKLANFWYYYKWHILGALLALVLLGWFLADMAGRENPDYQISILSSRTLPDDVIESLETQLSTLADDRNSDGKAVVTVDQYVISYEQDGVSGTSESASPQQPAAEEAAQSAMTGSVDAYTQMAGVTKLAADAQSGITMLFLTDNVEGYERSNALFAYNDGTTPTDEATLDLSRLGVRWGDCPALTGLSLGSATYLGGDEQMDLQTLMADYVLVKRSLEGSPLAKKEDIQSYYESSCALFERLTAK